jgi:hypothetical protein
MMEENQSYFASTSKLVDDLLLPNTDCVVHMEKDNMDFEEQVYLEHDIEQMDHLF